MSLPKAASPTGVPAPGSAAPAGLALAAAAGLNRCLLTAYLFLGANGIVSHSPIARPWPYAFAFAAVELAAAAVALTVWLRSMGRAATSRHQFSELPWSRAIIAGAVLAGALATANTTTQLTPPPLALALLVLTTALASTLPPFTSSTSIAGRNANGNANKMVVAALAAGVLILAVVHAPVLNLWSLVSAIAAISLALLFVALPWASLTSIRTLIVACGLLSLAALASGVLSATIPLPSPYGNATMLAVNAGILAIALRFDSSSSSSIGLGSASAFLLASLIAVTAWGIPTDAFAVHPIGTALAYLFIYLPAGLLVFSLCHSGYASVTHVRVHNHDPHSEGDTLFKLDRIIIPATSDNDDEDSAEPTLSPTSGVPSPTRRSHSGLSATPSQSASTWLAALLGGIFALTLSQIIYAPVIPGADPCANLLFDRQHPVASPGTKVLVTGGSGFIGSNLVELLLDLGYKVRVLDNLSTGYFHNIAHLVDHPRFEFQLGDILDLPAVEKAVDGVEYVYHLAAMSKVAPSMKDPKMAKYCLETNSLGTINVLNASRNTGGAVKKVVYAASSTYYGNGKTPMREDAAPDLLTPYSSSKYEGEIQMDIYDRIFNLPTVSIRFMMVFGPRQPTSGAYAIVTGVFVKKLQDDQPLPIEGDGSHFRDFVHVRDIGETLILAQQHPTLRNQVINSGTGIGHSVHEVADLVSPNHKHVAPRKNDLVGTLADTCKAKRMLGFQAKYDFVHEMSKIIDDAKQPTRVTSRPEFQQLARNLTAAPWLLPPQSLQYLFKPHVKDLAKAAHAAVTQPEFVKKPAGGGDAEADAKSLVVIPYTKQMRPLVEQSLYTVVTHGRAPHVLLVAQDTQDASNDCTLMNAACFDAQGASLTHVVAQLLDLGYSVHVVRPGTAYVRQVWRSFRPLLAATGAKMLVPNGSRASEGLWQYVATPEASSLVSALASAEEADGNLDAAYSAAAYVCGTRRECEAALGNKVAVAQFKTAYQCLKAGNVPFTDMCEAAGKHIVYFDPACVDVDATPDKVADKLRAAKVWWMAEGTCPETAEVCIGVPKRLLKVKEPGTKEGELTCVGGQAVL